MRVLSLFSGIGAYERALEQIGVDFEIINYCEILKDKSRAYSILHNVSEEKNLFDVTKIDTKNLEDFDLLCYSPPCQSFSKSGKKLGIKDIRGTLFYNALKIIEEKRPKYCVMENVDNLAGKKFEADFKLMRDSLEVLGYKNYWKVINAKDFVPQNRARVYLVSIRDDIDDDSFEFPIGENKDNWWDVIDLSDMRELTNRQKKMITYAKGESFEPVNIEGKVQFDNAVITLRQSGLRFQNNREYPTLTAHYGKGGGNFTMIARNGEVLGGITPRNCFKLMGFEFEDSEKLTKNGFSKSSQYIMAGDSVCVSVLKEIFKKLFKKV